MMIFVEGGGVGSIEHCDWELQPPDSLHILAGIALDGQPTRGEIDLEIPPPNNCQSTMDSGSTDGIQSGFENDGFCIQNAGFGY